MTTIGATMGGTTGKRHHGIDTDAAWACWLAGLADPRAELRVAVCGRDEYPRWDLGRRRLGEHMLHAVLAGGQEGTVAGAPVRTRPGDLLWVPAGVEQDLRLAAGERRLGKVFLRFACATPWPPGEPAAIHLPAAARLLGEAVLEARGQGFARDALVRAHLVALFVAWRRARAVPAGALGAEALRRVYEVAGAPGGTRATPTQLAAAVGMHPTVFARRFRRATGASPRAWLARRRIEAVAERLLSDPRPVAAVAADAGWDDPGLFSRRFSRVMGMAPGAWRNARAAR
jgi:AraC-like DNA-binding protein